MFDPGFLKGCAMRALELADYPVREIRFGRGLTYESGILEIDEDGLTALATEDDRILSANLAIVRPGEKARVTGIRDVVEPRVKIDEPGEVFPGVLGPVMPVGEGRTHRLSGMAVVTSVAYEGTVRTGTTAQRSAILDMWGPGAEATHFSSLVNLVLTLKLVPGLPEYEAHKAIQQAEYRVARRLAEATGGLEPQHVEIHDQGSIEPGLPRIVLIIGCLTEAGYRPSNVSYYGLPILESLSTIISPNEMVDGAVTSSTIRTVSYHPVTWDWQNHPLAVGLNRDHGQALNFAGVILERIGFENFHEKEVAAHNTAQVAASLHADSALITWTGSGNAFLEVMLTIRACENRGIKTVLVTYEYGGKNGVDSPLLFYDKAADAVVSMGSRDWPLQLPAAARVVGAYKKLQILNYPGAPFVDARDPMTLEARDVLVGGVDIWGGRDWTCRAY